MTRAAFVVVLALGCSSEKNASRADASASSSSVAQNAAREGSSGVVPAGMSVADAGDGGDAAAAEREVGFHPHRLALDRPPENRTKLPKTDDWKDVLKRKLFADPIYECYSQQVEEWIRVSCNTTNALVTLVAGKREGVFVWAGEDSAQMIFPVVAADPRVFQILPNPKFTVSTAQYGGLVPQGGGEPLIVSTYWPDDESPPMLVAQQP